MPALIWMLSAEPNANTPSSTNASLPTPPALKSSHVFLASPVRSFGGDNWYSEERSIPPPNAPLLKDLDSFTEGTGQGSFDFPLATGADEAPMLPLIFHPPENYDEDDEDVPTPTSDSLALDRLPSPGDLTDVVLAWRESVEAIKDTTSSERPPKKRRRSFNQDSETEEPRTRRAWSPTIDSSLIPYADNRDQEMTPEQMDCHTEPEAPG
ncbi:hypothetical protein GALMADRAFT_208343 [Galerina marginata CBS 339.88]|uniref:Uncharacterized protein n=1 Tax=Galerina marginata (strain CBS 339.88) TaxID=685588 RepID=A0A067TAJ0_GALM3|nr:hypothetical protein GALMADRAFT_208343 [Galerina marginata CBS 339.88]